MISFTTRPSPQWTKKIMAGLQKECEALTGLTTEFPAHTIYATQNNLFVGGVIMEHYGSILWIDALWVQPELREKGLGKQLMKQAFNHARHLNVREVQLNTFFESAHCFFLACGFKDVASIPNWKYDLTCYLMRRRI